VVLLKMVDDTACTIASRVTAHLVRLTDHIQNPSRETASTREVKPESNHKRAPCAMRDRTNLETKPGAGRLTKDL